MPYLHESYERYGELSRDRLCHVQRRAVSSVSECEYVTVRVGSLVIYEETNRFSATKFAA